MKIEILTSNSDSFPWSLIVLWLIVWLCVLYRILTRTDFDTPAKILWVMVVIFVPFFGLPLYWLAAPQPARAASKDRPVDLQSDVAGTPWAGNPGFRRDS